MRRLNPVRWRAMNKDYRKRLVYLAGLGPSGVNYVASPGITYMSADGIRIPRSMRHLIDRRWLP